MSQVKVASGDTVWLVTRHDDVRAVLADQRFSRNLDRPDAAQLIPGVRQLSSPFADPPAHTRWRKLVTKSFTPKQIEGSRARIEAIVEGLLDRIEAQSPPVDLVASLAFPLPIGVICDLLGIGLDQHEPFRALATAALAIGDSTAEEKRLAFEGMERFSRSLIVEKRESPGDDFLSRLIAVHDDDDGRLSEDELVATVLTLLIGGYENTAHQIGRGLLALFKHDAQLARLRADPSLVRPAVEEMLRFASTDAGYGSPRYATVDVEVGGVVIPKGATVLVIRQSANRDERHFGDPDRFDITRNGGQHFAFGGGPHYCLGASLARLELEACFSGLLRRFPELRLAVPVDAVPWVFRVTAAGPVELPVTW